MAQDINDRSIPLLFEMLTRQKSVCIGLFEAADLYKKNYEIRKHSFLLYYHKDQYHLIDNHFDQRPRKISINDFVSGLVSLLLDLPLPSKQNHLFHTKSLENPLLVVKEFANDSRLEKLKDSFDQIF